MQLVRNGSGVLIPRGKAVYCMGSSGELLYVNLARANSTNTMPAMGITLEALPINGDGRIAYEGDVQGVDTSAWALGDVLYVSAATAGALTNVAPASPNLLHHVGVVVVAGTEGKIALRSHGMETIWTTLVKTADQTNNSATLADDTVLQFTPLANTQYTIRLLAFLLTNATQDSKYRMVHTGTTTRVRRRVKRTATTDIVQTIELKTAFDAADVVLSTTGLNPWVEEDIILQAGATPGVVKFQFGQVTAGAGPTQCLEGSYLEYAVA